jgi:hypothetical protein
MATTDDRPTITCPSWCTAPGSHLDDEEGILHASNDVLALELPALAEEQGGRSARSSVEVFLTQYVRMADGRQDGPCVFVRARSGTSATPSTTPPTRPSAWRRRWWRRRASSRQSGPFLPTDAEHHG